MTKDKEEIVGHGFERANICAQCRGTLMSEDKHYHTRMSRKTGAEPICCDCADEAGRYCSIRENPPTDLET